MNKDPWTDPDPQPGDFDEYLANVDPENVEFVDPDPESKVKLVVIDTDDVDGWLRRRSAEAKQHAEH